MRIAIVGSAGYKDETRLFPIMSAFIEDQAHSNITIITGSMEGVERSAGRFAHTRGYDCVVFRPTKPLDSSMTSLMKSVYVRNKHIVDNSDKVLAFWDGTSPETEHLIKYARNREVPVMIITI